jgi:hypothetical protein
MKKNTNIVLTELQLNEDGLFEGFPVDEADAEELEYAIPPPDDRDISKNKGNLSVKRAGLFELTNSKHDLPVMDIYMSHIDKDYPQISYCYLKAEIDKFLELIDELGKPLKEYVYTYYDETDNKYRKLDEKILIFDNFVFKYDGERNVNNKFYHYSVHIYYKKEIRKKIDEICDKINAIACKKNTKKSHFYLPAQNSGGLYLNEIELEPTKLDIDLLYKPDFREHYDIIIKRLSKKKDKGIVFLHGPPGTGKTTFIRYLIYKLCKKKIIYITPDLVHHLGTPSIMPFLIENRDCILIIEDGEAVIKKQVEGRNPVVSNLLNISDGLLSDALNIQIVCTFNAKKVEIDEALLRKGRLITEYEFTKLPIEQCKRIAEHYKIPIDVKNEMTLTEIFNYDEKDLTKEEISIGF